MATAQTLLVIQQRRSDAVVAGLSWHTIVSTDLKDREKQVTDFAQSRSIDRLVVLETPLGLQVGYCERMRMPVTGLRETRLAVFALLVRRLFEVEQLLLVWRVEAPDSDVRYSVIIFEEGMLVLDRVLDAATVEDVVTTYLENTTSLNKEQMLSNDTALFPEFTDISALNWMDEQLDGTRLRPPRRPRLIDPEKRPVQAMLILLSLIVVSLTLAWYVWSVFIAKPKPVAAKPKVTPEAAYLRMVTEQIASLGWRNDAVRDVMTQMMETPMTQEGWFLRQAACGPKDCSTVWAGLDGADERVLEGWGRADKDKGNSRVKQLTLRKPHSFKLSGLVTVDRLRSRIDAKLFCEREAVILRHLGVRPMLNCRGDVWPDKAPKLAVELTVQRYRFTVRGDWVTLDRLLDRYADAVYWREVRLYVDPAKTDLLEMVEFELSGDLYGYR